MEQIKVVDDWRDKMLGDLKNFSEKKYKPVGMHHLTKDLNNYIGMKDFIKLNYFPLSKDIFKTESKFKTNKISKWILNKVPSELLERLEKKDNIFSENAKSVIIYLLPIPKVIFMQDINYIKEYFKELNQEKKKIDQKLLHALAKYGYWGIPEGDLEKRFFGNLDKNAILSSSNLGEIAPNGFFITADNGPRVFASYMITDAPLKQELDKPMKICNDECLDSINNGTEYLEYYKKTFGLRKTISDSIKSITSDNKFGEFVTFCYNCKMGKGLEINLIVKDPLAYKD